MELNRLLLPHEKTYIPVAMNADLQYSQELSGLQIFQHEYELNLSVKSLIL